MRATFQVQVKPSDFAGEVEIHVTRNGYQWQVVTLEADEAAKVASAIAEFVNSRDAAGQTTLKDKREAL